MIIVGIALFFVSLTDALKKLNDVPHYKTDFGKLLEYQGTNAKFE